MCFRLLKIIIIYVIYISYQDNVDLQLLCRMTALGLNAWEMIDKGNFKEPKLVSLK